MEQRRLMDFLHSRLIGDEGVLHARAYLFHREAMGTNTRGDRLQPFAAIVGCNNFTGGVDQQRASRTQASRPPVLRATETDDNDEGACFWRAANRSVTSTCPA
jgi:hypothetical protein